MADTIIGAHDGTFKTEGSISMRETQEFLALREGLSAASFESSGLAGSISLQKLYDASNAGEIVLAGNAAYPSSNYSLGGLRGSSYQNNTAPVISLLGPNVFFVNTDTEVLEVPESYITSQQACNPNVDLAGYVYDAQHYIVRYASIHYLSTYAAAASVFECYCYGSASSFVSLPTSTQLWPDSFLFNESICVGWGGWSASAQYSAMGLAMRQILDALENVQVNHAMDTTQGGSVLNYRDYIHPQACQVGGGPASNPVEAWYTNAIVSADPNGIILDRGATQNHLAEVEYMMSNIGNVATSHVSIFPIKSNT